MDEKTRTRLRNDEEIVKSRFPQLLQMLERTFAFRRWGFRPTFLGVTEIFTPSIIYDSEKCRIRFLWYSPDVREEPTIYIRYGRLHAPNDQRYVVWNRHQCYCWHNPSMAFHFLDGLTPREAIDNRYKWPGALEEVERSIVKQRLPASEGQAKLHSASWEHYGERLFSLFDLNQPSLWDDYILFMKACYVLNPFTDDYGYRMGYEVC